MSQKVEDPKWWRYLVRFLLGLTVVAVCLCIISLLALNFSGRNDGFGHLIVHVVYFSYSLGVSYGVLLVVILLATIGLLAGLLLKYSLKLYMIILAISLPLIFYFENTF